MIYKTYNKSDIPTSAKNIRKLIEENGILLFKFAPYTILNYNQKVVYLYEVEEKQG